MGQGWKIDGNKNSRRTPSVPKIRSCNSIESKSESRRITLSNDNSNVNREKYLEALEKKRNTSSHKGATKSSDSKIKGGQSAGNSQKMFRRKTSSS
jgi:hypothetical protein